VGIDYGTDWFKVALKQPGASLDLVLNRESKRKTASHVLIRDQERLFGNDATSLSVRFPKDYYPGLKNLLGKHADSAAAQEYARAYPNVLAADARRNTVVFKHSSGETYTVEELVAYQLRHACDQAKAWANDPVMGAVITVPPYWGIHERQALLAAANLAELRVLGLMNDHAAVAINFIANRKVTDPEYHVFYDMGAGSTVATVVKFHNVQIPIGPKYKKTVLEAAVLGSGFDATLGGKVLDHSLQQLFVEQFNDKYGKKLVTPLAENGRALTKLMNCANKVKHILSANNEAFGSVESLAEDFDFRTRVTRSEMEALASDFFDRVSGPIEQALQHAGLAKENVTSVVLVGGGVRVPHVQTRLAEYLGSADKIAKNVNQDEAAVLGASFQAAKLSRAFKVKDIALRDLNAHAVYLVRDAPNVDADAATEPPKEPRVIFDTRTKLGTRSKISLRESANFAFSLSYATAATSDAAPATYAPIATVRVTGLDDQISAHRALSQEPSKVVVHLELNDSGNLVINKVAKAANATTAGDAVSNGTAPGASPDASSPDGSEASVNGTRVAKVDLAFEVDWVHLPPLTDEEVAAAHKRIAAMDHEDALRVALAEARNTFEGYIYASKDFLDDEAASVVWTATEHTTLVERLDAAGAWLYEPEAETAETAEFQTRLKVLKDAVGPIKQRWAEHRDRPGAIEQFKKDVQTVRDFIAKYRQDLAKALEPPLPYTAAELDELSQRIDDHETWLSTQIALQEKLAPTAEAVLRIEAIQHRAKNVLD
ncbi:hypothetical protein CXG81DRAFT_5259, partial [Caulochytrium protostelioides]